MVATGKLSLGANDPLMTTSGVAGSPEYTEPCRVFTRDTLADY